MKHQSLRQRAFSLTELMVTVAIIGILSSIVIHISGNEWRRQRVQAVQVDLVGWLEAVRRAALRGRSCTATIDTTMNTPGQDLGRVDNNCSYRLAMMIPGIAGRGTEYQFTATPNALVFTPRGSVRSVGARLETDGLITITLVGGGPVGCIAISPSVGAIRSGMVNGDNPAACKARLGDLL